MNSMVRVFALGLFAAICLAVFTSAAGPPASYATSRSTTGADSSSRVRLTPAKIRRKISAAMTEKLTGQGSYPAGIKKMHIDVATLAQKGNLAKLVDRGPYRAGDTGLLRHNAARKNVKLWIALGGGFLKSDNPVEEKTTYLPTLTIISNELIAASGKPIDMFGAPIKVSESKNKTGFALFGQTKENSIRKLEIDQTGRVIKVSRFN